MFYLWISICSLYCRPLCLSVCMFVCFVSIYRFTYLSSLLSVYIQNLLSTISATYDLPINQMIIRIYSCINHTLTFFYFFLFFVFITGFEETKVSSDLLCNLQIVHKNYNLVPLSVYFVFLSYFPSLCTLLLNVFLFLC